MHVGNLIFGVVMDDSVLTVLFFYTPPIGLHNLSHNVLIVYVDMDDCCHCIKFVYNLKSGGWRVDTIAK